jgi:hypothetical protein
VNNVPDRPPAISPRFQHPGNIGFSLRVVAFTPTRIKERSLHIDDNQCSGLWQLHD